MKVKKYKELEKKIDSYNFSENYKTTNIVGLSLSYFGNIASIFLAFFFMSEIISSATQNKVAVVISSLIILTGIELLKRDFFDKFSIQSLKDGGISKNVAPLMIASLLFISASFYSSINGAKIFSSKSKEIEVEVKKESRNISDSINKIYEPRIEVLRTQNNELFESNKKLDEEARELPNNWVTNKNRIRKRIDINLERIDKNDEKIKVLKEERDEDISELEDEIKNEAGQNKEENSKNSFIFIIISSLIEIIILAGVYFSEYYKFRSYKEERKRREKDPNYQKWVLYDNMLNVIISNDSKVGEKLPTIKSMVEMLKVNDIIVTNKDVSNFLKILSGLKIIRISGPAKYINKTKKVSQEILKEKFNIN